MSLSRAIVGLCFWLAGWLPLGSAVASPLEGGVIQVKSVAEITPAKAPPGVAEALQQPVDEITLGDLIVARGVSPEALEKLQRVRLADVPSPGESRSFTGLGLEQIFRPLLREIETKTGEKINLRVPARVIVMRKSFRLLPTDVDRELKKSLAELCRDCQFEITSLSLPVVPANISAGSTWSIHLKQEMPHGSFSVPLDVANEDGSRRTYWITGSVVITKKVPVASRSLNAGERVNDEDYTIESRDVTFASDVAPAPADFKTSLMSRAIAAGQVIWRSALRREMAVKNGDVVKVLAGADGWQISIDGIAQSAGYIGDTVNVKIPRTQKLVSGLLTEKGVVEVH